MSRCGYSDDLDPFELGRWRGRVASALRGKRGQAFLRELLAALDAIPEKRLVKNAFESNGEVCALGSVARTRGIAMPPLDEDDEARGTGPIFGIADPMAREIMFWNDEGAWEETPEQRWQRMRKWVVENIAEQS